MALTAESAEKNLGLKVEGDLGDLQIIEEQSDSEDESGHSHYPRTLSTLSAMPSDLVSESKPTIDSVVVTNSENVQFGNNTYFNGPVTIKQVIKSINGNDNAAYVKTDIESPSEKYHSNSENSTVQKFKVHTWHKLTVSTIAAAIIGGICAFIVLRQSSNTIDLPQVHSSASSNDTPVVGLNFLNYSILISIFLVPLILLIMYQLSLTKDSIGIHQTKVADKKNDNNIENLILNSYTYKVKEDELLVAPGHLRIVSRTDWLAQPVETPLDKIVKPVPWVIITHTATASCFTQSSCVLSVRLMQTFHIESKGWSDIAYNFLVGGDGSAYYGRGWDHIGAHTKGYNKYSIGIAFIGTFNSETPTRQQVEACKKLIKQGVDEGYLAKDYKLLAHRQLMSTLSPGDQLFDIMKKWSHFVKNDTDITELIPNY